jgi:hypothetical protein
LFCSLCHQYLMKLLQVRWIDYIIVALTEHECLASDSVRVRCDVNSHVSLLGAIRTIIFTLGLYAYRVFVCSYDLLVLELINSFVYLYLLENSI